MTMLSEDKNGGERMLTPTSENEGLTSAVGTSFYIAPEIISGKKYSQKVDMYSLGIIFFELLHPNFQTAMERSIVLFQLRKEKVRMHINID